MAIINPMYAERDHLRMRMDRASCRDEYEYFRERLHELEHREMVRDMRYINEPPRIQPVPAPTSLTTDPAKPDPLSFMRNANNKLLLIGATT